MGRWKAWLCLLGLLIVVPLPAQAGSKLLGANQTVSDIPSTNFGEATKPDVAARGNTVYAVWRDTRDYQFSAFNYAIYFAKSTDGGLTWERNVRVSRKVFEGDLDDPSIALGPDGTIWIIWYLRTCYAGFDGSRCGGTDRKHDVRVARSTDGGASFREGVVWNGNDALPDSTRPELAVDTQNGNLYVLVHAANGEGYDIIFLSRDQAGNAIGAPKVSTGNGRPNKRGEGPAMALAARGSTVCAAWEDRRQEAIYGACSTNRGQSFGSNVSISGVQGFYPRLAIAPDGAIYAAYQLADGNIYLRRSTDTGRTWGNPALVSNLQESAETADWDLAVDANGTVAILWAHYSGSFGGFSDLFLSSSVDRGQSFSATKIDDERGNTASVASQFHPRLATLGHGEAAHAVLVWGDDRNTRQQIWSARAELDGIPPTAPTSLVATAGDTSIGLSWMPATDRNGIRGYHVFRATASVGPYMPITSLPVTGTSFRDVGLREGTYFYRVVALDGTGNAGPASAVARATATSGTGLRALAGMIAYNSGGDIRLRGFDDLARERVLAQGITPRFGADGKHVYYFQPSAFRIASSALQDGETRTLYQDRRLTEWFDLAADPSYVAAIFKTRYFGPALPGGFCDAFEPRLHQVAPAKLLYNHGTAIASHLALSPDQRWMVYSSTGFCNGLQLNYFSRVNFCVVNLLNNKRTCTIADYQDPSFAPEGDWLAFAANLTGQREIWKARVEPDGSLSSFTQITRGAPGQPAAAPSWSSDGNWLIFQRDVDPGSATDVRLFVVRADGDYLRALDIVGTRPVWFGGSARDIVPYTVYLPLARR